jgi:hypothetical protein
MQKKEYFWQIKLSAIIFILSILPTTPLLGEQVNQQSWKEDAKKEKLSQSDIEKLSENGIVVTNTSYRQIFTPYLLGSGTRVGGIPLFITTDSLINAYHVLYEESILRLENANAKKLGNILRFVLTNLPKSDDKIKGNPQLAKAAYERAYIVVGTAMKLLDEDYKFEDGNIEKIINAEVGKIEQASAREKPSWLGKTSDDLITLDYSRYKPRGFYTSSERLSKYFRAVSWLQSIPFRLNKDDELLSIMLLGNCLTSESFRKEKDKQQEYTGYFSTFKELIGSGDDWDVIKASEQVNGNLSINLNNRELVKIREKFEKELEKNGISQINDQIRFPPRDSNSVAEPQFRFISAFQTPDAVLFQRTTDIREFKRDFPNGLEVCAALGSEFARNKLDYTDKTKLLKTIDDTKKVFSGDSLYLDYLKCLSCLLDEPPIQAPAFMKNSAWQAKSCNATLAGWSQLRHTWALQAKQNAAYGASSVVPAGFVEPEPDFYERMASLAQKSKKILEKAGAFNPDYSSISQKIMNFVKFYEIDDFDQRNNRRRGMSEYEQFEIWDLDGTFSVIKENNTRENYGKYSKEELAKITKIAQDLEDDKLPENERLAKSLQSSYMDIKYRWDRLKDVSETLAKISKSELEGKDLKEYDEFIKSYGTKIGSIMLYGGNTYYSPNDDSMRIVDVYNNLFVEEKFYLHAGIGRARAIYVLYPWQGSLVLCKGAIMPYYEFTSDERLTDSDWKTMLDSQQRPKIADWLKQVFSE